MKIEKSVLTGLGIKGSDADKYLAELNSALPANGIDSFLRVAHFLSQVVHESGHMKFVEEQLNYSAERLHEIFPRRFPTLADAQPYHRKPEKIGNRIYGGRLGNGPESSGDGFKYRGRGLIQLTGKSNYKAFADWVGDDAVLSDPDLVATKYPVTSAVYFWAEHNINRHADVDDVKAVTKAINGGYNGLADRIKLLIKAKELVNASPQAPSESPPAPAGTLEGATHRVSATSLNFRSSPEVPRLSSRNRIGSLGRGKEVVKIKDADNPGWVQIRTLLNGVLREGFVSEEFLERIPGAAAAVPQVAAPTAPPPIAPSPPPPLAISPSHMKENRRDITRARDGGRAYPLGEAGQPRRTASTPEKKAEQLIQIVNYLDSANPDHLRYRPKSGTTYCNIYAYDYCYLAGVFLPRTWWTGPALRRLRAGEDVGVVYGETVRELNANSLHDWFDDYGAGYGWRNEVDLDSLQVAANAGEVCIIVAQRTDLNRSGHIVAVAPEHDEVQAKRKASGEVMQPVESQAGVRNFRFRVGNKQWWQDEKFRSFGFWRAT
jgi:predicted chitinase